MRSHAPDDDSSPPAFDLTRRIAARMADADRYKEHQLFGEDGFEKMVDRVAAIEKTLGIYDLAQFTPRA